MHILIIEDDPLTAMMLAEMLGFLGSVSFDIAATETQAVELAERQCPDLMTVDLRLERGSGADAVAAITRDRPVPVVFITGSPESVAEFPAPIVLVKPFDNATLRAAIEIALGPDRIREPDASARR